MLIWPHRCVYVYYIGCSSLLLYLVRHLCKFDLDDLEASINVVRLLKRICRKSTKMVFAGIERAMLRGPLSLVACIIQCAQNCG